jgi:hypothetical protein
LYQQQQQQQQQQQKCLLPLGFEIWRFALMPQQNHWNVLVVVLETPVGI